MESGFTSPFGDWRTSCITLIGTKIPGIILPPPVVEKTALAKNTSLSPKKGDGVYKGVGVQHILFHGVTIMSNDVSNMSMLSCKLKSKANKKLREEIEAELTSPENEEGIEKLKAVLQGQVPVEEKE